MIDKTAWALIGQSLMKQSQKVKNSDADSAKIFATSDFFFLQTFRNASNPPIRL